MRRFERRVVGESRREVHFVRRAARERAPARRTLALLGLRHLRAPALHLRVAEKLRPPPSKRIDAGANPAAGTFGGETGQGAGIRMKRIGRPRAAGEHDHSPPPFFLESKTAKRGDRLEAVSSRKACGAGPLLSATLESEPAEVRALFRKQMDRLCWLGRKSSALRQHWLVAQKQSARPISE
jgi:hypothetical protein